MNNFELTIIFFLSMKTLSNEKVTIQLSEHGAELTSIVAGDNEYLWQADPKFWARHSPVLFPFVGRVWNNTYRHEGKAYTMGQHGFARDMDFQLSYEEEDAVVFSLESDEQTFAKYPFRFVLEIGYRLKGNCIEVMWNVQNTGDTTMHFQIGAHPAFYYRDLDVLSDERGWLDFGKGHKSLQYICPVEKGCVSPETHTLQLPDGVMPLTTTTFACDTYIFENDQLQRLVLLDKQRKPYLGVSFRTPLVAVWSPSATHPDVPFICLEPWYGRCDQVGYEGELKDREWMQHLAPGKCFHTSYTIELLDI